MTTDKLKTCANNGCWKIIYPHQGESKFCDNECMQQSRQFNNIGKYRPTKAKQGVYPHKDLPISIVID